MKKIWALILVVVLVAGIVIWRKIAFEKACQEDMNSRFGTVSLSPEEVHNFADALTEK